MAYGFNRTIFPKYDYGQGSGAWNPATGAPVYRKMEYARFDAAFALIFCMDILFGKERSGEECWFWVAQTTTRTDENGNQYQVVTDCTREKFRTRGRKGKGWLYNDNTLNASQSGVPQVFGPPAAKVGGTWRYALPCTSEEGDPLPPGVPQFSFVIEGPLEGGDTAYIRMLDSGNAAFAATDYSGVTVCVPYALHWEPVKQRRGRPEAGDSKASPINGFYYR